MLYNLSNIKQGVLETEMLSAAKRKVKHIRNKTMLTFETFRPKAWKKAWKLTFGIMASLLIFMHFHFVTIFLITKNEVSCLSSRLLMNMMQHMTLVKVEVALGLKYGNKKNEWIQEFQITKQMDLTA